MKNAKFMAANRSDINASASAAELDALLAELASSTLIESAPPRVRDRLLAQARLQAKLALQPPPRVAALLAAALSALLLIGVTGGAVSLVLGRSRLSSTANAVLHSLGLGKSAPPATKHPIGGQDASSLPPSRQDHFLLMAETPAAGSLSETALSSEVFTLPYSDNAIANGTEATVRISVPSSELLAWGVPSVARGLDDEIPAYLLLGDDGLPQAIRVLPASTTTAIPTEEIYP